MRMGRGFGVAALAVAGLMLAGCSVAGIGGNGSNQGPNARGRPATVVNVAKAANGPISEVADYTGTVQPTNTVNVVPQIAGQIVKLDADVGSKVTAGQVLAQLDQSTIEEQVAQAQEGVDAAKVKLAELQAQGSPASVDQAKANLAAAQAKLAAVQGGPRPENVAVAQANLATAQAKLAAEKNGPRPETVAEAKANLEGAQAKLNQLLAGPTADQVASANLQVEQSKDALAAAQANKDGQCNPRNPHYMCEAAQAQAFADETAVNVAEQNLKTLTDPPTPDAVKQDQAAVDAAEQALKLAQTPYTSTDIAQAQAAVDAAGQQVKLAQTPYTSTDVAQAQAAVDAAQAQLQAAEDPNTALEIKAAQVAVQQAQEVLAIAQTQLKETSVVAPFDGVISAKLLSPGALASPSTPIFTLISDQPQVQFAIGQAQIDGIKVGQAVNLTSNAFPGKLFSAKVASIYPSADPKTHTFTVAVQPDDVTDLRAGMFVSLALTVASDAHAVLVPTVAIVQQGSQSVVFTVADGKAHLQPVTIGLSDDQNSQILKGVSAGQEVVTTGQTDLSDNAPVRIAGQGATGGGSPGKSAGSSAGRSGRGASGQGQSGHAKPESTRTSRGGTQ